MNYLNNNLKLLLLIFSVFIVSFPAVIESGSEAKLCVSLLKLNEALQLTVYLHHNNQNRTLLQERVEEEFHRCSQFKAPEVEGLSVQEIRVEVRGESFVMTEKRKVMFRSYNPQTFIQTDKPIYNPGQTVNFRVVTLDANLVPLQRQVRYFSFKQDNNGNRIGQWMNVSSTGLILQLSHQLNSEAPEGVYKLEAKTGYMSTFHYFTVKKYVLTRFEITVKAPKEQSVAEEELKIEVCGKYTYGQPVPGEALLEVCWNFLQPYYTDVQLIIPCLSENIKMDEDGCASHVFNMSLFSNSEFEHNFRDSLDINVVMTEEGTGISMVKSERTSVTYESGKAEFLDLPKNFERDTVIEGKIKVVTYGGEPIRNKEVYLLKGPIWSPTLLLNLTTNDDGLAKFAVDAPAEPETEILLLASVYLGNQYQGYRKPFFRHSDARIQVLQPATPYSPVYSEISIESLEEPIKCDSEVSVNLKYYIISESTKNYSTDLIYTVISRGAIVHHGYKKVEVKESKRLIEGRVSFKLSVVPEMAPVVQVLVYGVLPSENVIAASRGFIVDKCFTNKVSLQFSPTEAVPGEENSLQLSALPGSLCALSAVDQSVFILEPGKRLNADTVFRLLPLKSIYYHVVEDQPECLHVRPRRASTSDYAYDSIKVTACISYLIDGHVYALTADYSAQSSSEPLQTVRSFFPETWIWQLVEVGDSGSAQVPVTVPDTITTWEMDTFCLSSRGVGVAPAAQLRVFQPFFLELSLPYSIIRGEEFELKATVFNYLSKCIMVKVTPAPSSDYTLKASSSDEQYSSCLCAKGRKTFRWTLVPSVLGVLNVTVNAAAEPSQALCDNEIVSVPDRGRIDTVTRSLLVKAEGTEKTKSQSWLLCPQGNSVSEELELTLPEDVIGGSARASLSVLGDILGRALKNIDGLLKMPYGCGEQNIALLSPNIYILQYLENTQQLTPAIREKATGFLKSGYQRQLNYKHVNGAYSTFGRGEENTWLTAFVMRTFGKAQRYIFIDPKNIDQTKQWLISKQGPDGCFIRQGRLFNNRMKGGVNDNVTIAAYITASLLELGHKAEDPLVIKGLSCLKSSLGTITNTYATALLAYTFSLAGENEIRGQLLKKLDGDAISGDGRLHWSQSASEDSDSLSVEISSYVLLAALSTDKVSTADLGYANRIVSWLVRQQNPYGGFSSTQDTVVALQALALYATKVYSPDGSSTVTVQSADKETHSFEVNQNNKLLYQEKSLQNVPGKYSVSVNGSTCASVQLALFYNIPTPIVPSTLSVKVEADANCTKSFGYTLSTVFTVKYDGALNYTNMVIVDIKILSGFTADPTSLKNHPLVERVDTKDDHVILYLKALLKNIPVTYQLHIKQVLPVKNLKPAVIKVYDYYQPSKFCLVYIITVTVLILFTDFNVSFIQVTSLKPSIPSPVFKPSHLQLHSEKTQGIWVFYFAYCLILILFTFNQR
ncbi:alpha-2-macroglobulin-like [Astyanax mexicanus]|uniref:Alpha-2-macroglobulin-like n=1 Tax=Astyanax mexicanus TaxID=7994 RepID=A0A8T2L853_ASTMX|nr:alpha-2-macroglobulin-like [Astyanax mexicanus]